ncbi:hypothetical protein C7H19_14020 [Aphanothece hegewaldii CCALA 016]|uniref:Uncharacterized protein n=1 Tax=Aphanothece hegewaldii CCALA 016 TaxID=2107694 RepID=A0A2T1LW32_9CHRO|nr:hypothetical protein [Aphanothece hegewaldii]PSF36115.1 hypothetical protein C7H19_14020 [Aphanothece hegewaldii CCALA 016]
MTTATNILNTTDITADDYCVFGLATCFLKNDGEFLQVQVIEPIPSAALEAVIKGIPTSYQLVCALSVGDVLSNNTLHIPSHFPSDAQFCEDFNERLIAAVRTYKRRHEATQHIPKGTIKDDLNFSLERKRVLNAVNVVRTEDNVKQHSHTHQVL